MKEISKEKKFRAKPGQTDYTNIRWAPVLNCVVIYRGKILLVQRSPSLRLYPGYWNGISGFLDDQKSLQEKVIEELNEELGVTKKDIMSIHLGEVFDQDEPKYKKTWIVHPILVRIKTNHVVFDWEAQTYRWVTLRESGALKLLPGFRAVLRKLKLLARE
jgi:isopentenyldiphosphate isomerase